MTFALFLFTLLFAVAGVWKAALVCFGLMTMRWWKVWFCYVFHIGYDSAVRHNGSSMVGTGWSRFRLGRRSPTWP